LNILVATDGALDPDRAADAVARWYVDGDKVTVFTVLSVPTEFLRGLDSSGVTGAAQIALEAGQTLGAGDRAAERLIRTMPAKDTTKRDSPVLHALANTASERTQPIVDALKAKGIAANSNWRSTESKTARTILAKVKDFDADLVIIGSHGTGRYEGQLGATVTKLVRLAPATVLVIRNPTKTKD
jgi:nucleotide-binding universal stress UspA family protein